MRALLNILVRTKERKFEHKIMWAFKSDLLHCQQYPLKYQGEKFKFHLSNSSATSSYQKELYFLFFFCTETYYPLYLIFFISFFGKKI